MDRRGRGPVLVGVGGVLQCKDEFHRGCREGELSSMEGKGIIVVEKEHSSQSVDVDPVRGFCMSYMAQSVPNIFAEEQNVPAKCCSRW